MNDNRIEQTLECLTASFEKFLNVTDEEYLNSLAGWDGQNVQEILRYKNWDWFQGVGVYGFWKYYCYTKDVSLLNILQEYFQRSIEGGLPRKNINSVCPLLTLCYLYEVQPNEKYLSVIQEWASWVAEELPRTEENGFQHITSESRNDQQLWADTVFMTVLFLAKTGSLLHRTEHIEQAKYQMLLHIKYLTDRKTGLWFHGWTFDEKNNFADALWARGNCWITLAIPELIEMLPPEYTQDAACMMLRHSYSKQVYALKQLQCENGMWHTLLDDPTSYCETSGSAGIAAGIFKGVAQGLLDSEFLSVAQKTASAVLQEVDFDGTVHHVSIGTPMGKQKEFYKTIAFGSMAYGQALSILCLVEALKATH